MWRNCRSSALKQADEGSRLVLPTDFGQWLQLYTLERSGLLRNLQLREELQLLHEREGKSEAGRC